MNTIPLRKALAMACMSLLLAGCGDAPQEAPVEALPSGAPKVLPNALKVERHKKTYVITGIGVGGGNKVAIINNQVVKPGMEIGSGVVLEDVQPTYAIIIVGNTRHLLRPEDIQQELDEKGRSNAQ